MDNPTRNESVKRSTTSKEITTRGAASEMSPMPETNHFPDQEMKELEIVLHGGAPWGFALNGGPNTGAPLHISQIADGGKASESALTQGDCILLINNVPCSDVGRALDIMDTASNTLAITIVRKSLDVQELRNRRQFLLNRSSDLQNAGEYRSPGRAKRPSDDSVVYSRSKSHQLQAANLRHYNNKRRGDSFNVGRLNSVQSERRRGLIRATPSSLVNQPTRDSRSSFPYDRDKYPGYNDNNNISSPIHHQDNSSNMNRRRSEIPGSHSSPNIGQYHEAQHLVSIKSSPNLVNEKSESDLHINRSVLRDQTKLVKSGPGQIDHAVYNQHNMDSKYQADVSRNLDFTARPAGYGDVGHCSYSVGFYGPDGNSLRQNPRRSLPAHNLHRYQPDYENVSHLGTAPLRSEKISEIEDIDEVTSRDNSPQTPDVKEYDPFRGAGLPTRDPASLKYIKVNQNHEKYPSWPVTKPNGATEQTQPINSRAQSMTDHTGTSTEFPKKQQLAYRPGGRNFTDKNSPMSDGRADDTKTRNGSDPGFKSEFVYGLYGRVQRRDQANNEGRFDDFYNNSKPGYPPPNMDPDGRNIGDKEYNAPSPPERDNKGVDYSELSQKLGNIHGSGKPNIRYKPQGGVQRGQNMFYPHNERSYSASAEARPSELPLNLCKDVTKQNNDFTDTGTSPLDKNSPLSNTSQRNAWASSQIDGLSFEQNRQPSFYDNKQNRTRQELVSHSVQTNAINQTSYDPLPVWGTSPQRDHTVSITNPQRDKQNSTIISPLHSGKQDIPNYSSNNDRSKSYIVKSTPYYNTSTQTEMLPYAIKLSDPSVVAARSKHAEIQTSETSPKTLEDQGKRFEEKSIQARMSRDFENSDVIMSNKNDVTVTNKNAAFGARGQGDDILRYPSTTGLTSPFKGIESIHAKYATDEVYDANARTDNNKAVIPTFNDNASMLRKLSEEFYGNRLGLIHEKRMSSSSSQESPRLDPSFLTAAQQPSMRESDSYSSIVIHQDEKIGLFGGDDASSVSSYADSRHDMSSIISDSALNNKCIEMLPARGRRSLGSLYTGQKTRLYQQNSKSPPSKVFSKDWIGPASSFSSTQIKVSSDTGGKVNDLPVIGGHGSNSSSGSSVSRGDTCSSKHSSVFSTGESASILAGPSSVSLSRSGQGKQMNYIDRGARLESDSVFVADDDNDDIDEDDLSDYEFSRKPSMRKAYGIYDETEGLISCSKTPTKIEPEKQPTQSVVNNNQGSSALQSRSNRFSESLGLGRIQEESDSLNTGNDQDNSLQEASISRKKNNSSLPSSAGKTEKFEKYPWQNEAWLKSNVNLPTESNLRRTTSEQIPQPKLNTNVKVSSYDTESGHLQRGAQTNSAFNSQGNKNTSMSPSSNVSIAHSRRKSEDLLCHRTEQDDATFTKDTRRPFDRRLDPPRTVSVEVEEITREDISPYESISANLSSPESVADVICKVNENLAKSAERVDSIRRSNSSSSRNSSEYVDMTRERNRRETDWSRLRTSGSLRYSPDHERRSSRSSFASENLYEDISAFALSTPRSSFAESSDKNLEPVNSNASMDSGLVASPTYQNFPYQRRAPPPPPRSPSPDETPPALPPRKYREHQQPSNAEARTPTSHNPPPSTPGVANDKNTSNAMTSANKQSNEENQVDRTKRDFKSLMTQWENNTPREDKYAAELRKQAQKLNNTQHVNAIPVSYERTRTKINFSTTYKHEPMQPQEATSPPSSSSLSPSSQPSNISTNVSSSLSGVFLTSPSSSAQPSSTFHQTSLKDVNSSRITKQDTGSTFNSLSLLNDNPPLRPFPYNNSVAPSSSSFSTSSNLDISIQSKPSEKKKVTVDDFRNRSGSEVLHSKPPIGGSSDSTNKAQSTGHHHLGERSSSEHDILSDRHEVAQPAQQKAAQFSGHPNAPAAASKWRPVRVSADLPPLPYGQSKVEIVSMKDGKFASPPTQIISGRRDVRTNDNGSDDSDGFADGSYIGHKNKSSRAIGTYKRSKSAVVLETGGSGYRDADSESLPFQEPKLSQQSWSSESVLSRTDAAVDQVTGAGKLDKTGGERVPEYGNSASSSKSGRPTRQSTHGRPSVGQFQTSAYSSLSQNNNSTTSSPPGAEGRQSATDQRSNELPVDNFLRHPSTSNQESYYEWNPSTPRNKTQQMMSNITQNRPDDITDRSHFNNNVLQSHYSTSKNSNSNDSGISSVHSWNPYTNSVVVSFSLTSSQTGVVYSKPGTHGSWSSNNNHPDSSALQREYQRRESAPTRLNSSSNIIESKLDIPSVDSAGSPRRSSDSNVNSAQQQDQGNKDDSAVSHSRQPSQEELECDEKAKELARELADKEQKLSEVLRLDANKKRMQYMDGLFSESVDISNFGDRSSFSQESRSSVKNRSPQQTFDGSSNNFEASKRGSLPKEYWMSPSRALLEMELRRNEEASKDLTKDINDSHTLMKHKEELLEKLHKKLEVLKEEKMSLQQEISDNNLLGKQVFDTVEVKCQSHSERDKIKAYIDDLEKIVRLLLNLSGQLARAENAVQSLGPQVDAKIKKLTIDKRERLFAKHEEAKFLKEDIDKRSDQLSGVLRERLNEKEFSCYTHFIKMKSKLTIDLQELDDKITLGEEQILELRKSIPDPGSSSNSS